jgi:hypothetical protein
MDHRGPVCPYEHKIEVIVLSDSASDDEATEAEPGPEHNEGENESGLPCALCLSPLHFTLTPIFFTEAYDLEGGSSEGEVDMDHVSDTDGEGEP